MPDRLRAMFCDHPSIMRGKYLPAMETGNGFSSSDASDGVAPSLTKRLMIWPPTPACQTRWVLAWSKTTWS